MAALLDYSKFGITKEELSSFDYIFGYDLGHGEVSVSFKRVSDSIIGTDKKIKLVPDIYAEKVYSALAKRGNDHWELIYPGYLPDTELYLGFKRKPRLLISGEKYPGKDITCKELITIFTKVLFENIIKANNDNSDHSKDFSGKGLLVVGCPSDKKEWISKGLDVEYQKIIQHAVDGIGLDIKVVVMPESRASLLKVYKLNMADKKDDVTISEYMKRGIIVFDFGSSTLDSTSININTNVQADDSIPLGASLLEKRIMSLSKERMGWKDCDIANIDQSELKVRQGKEDFYSHDDDDTKLILEKKNFDDIKIMLTKNYNPNVPHIVHQIDMNALSNSEIVSYNTITDGEVKGTWYNLAEKFVKETKDEWQSSNHEEDFHGLVLITGGASRMLFVQNLIKNIFTNAYVYPDPDPSFCVSQGLVIAADTDIKAIQHLDALYNKINESLNKELKRFYELIAQQCSEPIYEFIKNYYEGWKDNGDDITLSMLADKIGDDFRHVIVDRSINDAIQHFFNGSEDIDGFKEVIASCINESFANEFPRISKNVSPFVLNDDMITSIKFEIKKVDIISKTNIIDVIDRQTAVWAAILNFFGFTPLKHKKLSRNEREELWDWFISSKLNRMKDGVKTLKNSFDSDLCIHYEKSKNVDSENNTISLAILNIFNKQIRPFVDEMVNHVSLYF